MPAYLIATKVKTKDEAELALYTQAAAKANTGNENLLVAYGTQEVLAGPEHEGMVVLEFPDMEAAKAWYKSDAYQEALKHRAKAAEFHVTLIEGFAGFPS